MKNIYTKKKVLILYLLYLKSQYCSIINKKLLIKLYNYENKTNTYHIFYNVIRLESV